MTYQMLPLLAMLEPVTAPDSSLVWRAWFYRNRYAYRFPHLRQMLAGLWAAPDIRWPVSRRTRELWG